MAVVRTAAVVFPPLDEELGLLPESYTPSLQEAMTRLGAKLPYEQAREEIKSFCHTLVSEPTIRRHTTGNGRVGEAIVKAETRQIERGEISTRSPALKSIDQRRWGLRGLDWRGMAGDQNGQYR